MADLPPPSGNFESERSNWLAEFFSFVHRFSSELSARWWLILLLICAGTALGAYQVYQAKPSYLSGGKLIAKPRMTLPSIGQANMVSTSGSDFFGTQLAIIQSPAVTLRATERVLLEDPSLTNRRARLSVKLASGTSILHLSATSGDETYAEKYLQAVMLEYIAYNSEQFAESSQATLDSITKELASLDKKLRDGENRLLEFQKTNNVVFLQEQGMSAGKSLAELNSKLAELNTEHELLKLLELDDPNAATPLEGVSGLVAAGSANTVGASALKLATEKLNELRIEREDWSLYLKDAHPRLVRLDDEIARQERLLKIYRQQSVVQLRERRQALDLQLKNLNAMSAGLELKSLESSHLMAEYERIKSEQGRHQRLYDRLLESIQTLDLSKNLGQDTFSILEHATPAKESKPDMIKTPAVGGVLGAFLGFGIVFMLQRFNDRLLTLTEVDREFQEEVLSQVPLEKIPDSKTWAEMLENTGGHAFVESFRTLRSSVLYMPGREENPKTILVTSALPGEGKSTVARNFAIHLAKGGSKTLLIDGDLRRGTMHRRFDPMKKVGLADVLMGKAELEDVLFDGGVPNLTLCTRGGAPTDPGELFIGAPMDILLAKAAEKFDHIIIDSAPIMATDDSTNLVSRVDTAVFVYRANYTSARVARIALEQIYRVGGAVLGLVFNSVDVHRRGYGYNYYYYYNYYRSYGNKSE